MRTLRASELIISVFCVRVEKYNGRFAFDADDADDGGSALPRLSPGPLGGLGSVCGVQIRTTFLHIPFAVGAAAATTFPTLMFNIFMNVKSSGFGGHRASAGGPPAEGADPESGGVPERAR